MNQEEIIDLVNEKFKAVNGGLVFEVIKEGVRADQSWWYVPVLVTRNGHDVPREVTVNIFANIETEIEEAVNVSVLFIPMVA